MMTCIKAVLRSRSAASAVLCIFAVFAMVSASSAVKRGAESVNCGGGESQSASYKAHDTIGQCPIGPVAEGGGMRAYDGFWLVLPNINVPVEGAVYAVLTDAGMPLLRWTVGTTAQFVGFNVYRSIEQEGQYVLLNEYPIPAESPGSYEDDSAWPDTEFWYEVRAVYGDGSEDAVSGSPVSVRTGGRLALRLYPLRPNPTSGLSTVTFDIPDHRGPVRLAIHNVRGQRVCAIVDGTTQRGRHELTWDCTDDRGNPLASGVYFARLEVDGRTDDQKVMVLR